MKSLRAAAVLLHSLEPSDRRWVLSRLTASERRNLQHIAPFVPKAARGSGVDEMRAMLAACFAADEAVPQPAFRVSGSWAPAQIDAAFAQAPEWLRSLAPSLLNESDQENPDRVGAKPSEMKQVAPEFLLLARRALASHLERAGSRLPAADDVLPPLRARP